MKKLENKIALITGATGGIGLATSTLFLQEGAKVVLVDKNQNELKKAEKNLSSKNARFFQADVTSESEMRNTISYTENQFGSLDIAFLNAGVEGPVKPIFDYTSDEFEKVMAINVRGVFWTKGLRFFNEGKAGGKYYYNLFSCRFKGNAKNIWLCSLEACSSWVNEGRRTRTCRPKYQSEYDQPCTYCHKNDIRT